MPAGTTEEEYVDVFKCKPQVRLVFSLHRVPPVLKSYRFKKGDLFVYVSNGCYLPYGKADPGFLLKRSYLKFERYEVKKPDNKPLHVTYSEKEEWERLPPIPQSFVQELLSSTLKDPLCLSTLENQGIKLRKNIVGRSTKKKKGSKDSER